MHLRRIKTKTATGTKRYAQLVHSYRRKSDGMPTQRVVANLGDLDDVAYENFRIALAAARKGKGVTILPDVLADVGLEPPKADATMQFLDLAVLHHIWKREGLDRLLHRALGSVGKQDSAAVIEALILQRCTAPDSKLAAVRWFADTALPQLFGIPATRFNNSRVHRALDSLEAARPGLCSRMADTFFRREGAFASLMLDVTDTWFVGHGPQIAEKGKTKEGFVRRKIAIVLLCNEHGYPLRWQVHEGNAADCKVMLELLDSVACLDWVGSTPVVCDRAMGDASTIAQMHRAKVPFLTALKRTEFDEFKVQLPYKGFANLAADGESIRRVDGHDEALLRAKDDAVALAAKTAVEAGMRKVQDNLYVLDQQMLTRQLKRLPRPTPTEDKTTAAMRMAQKATQEVADGSSLATAAKKRGVSRPLLSSYIKLLQLPTDIQDDVLAGKAAGRSLTRLLQIANIPQPEDQYSEFEALVKTQPRAQPRPSTIEPRANENQEPATIRVRAVAYFNPQVFVEKRATANRKRSEIESHVDKLNEQAAKRPHLFTDTNMLSTVRDSLKRREMLGVYETKATTVSKDAKPVPQVQLTLNEEEWNKRRRYDGFSVLVANPQIQIGADEMCRLFRAKDAVERDFREIKTVLELRPLHHHSEHKVRAHVSLCMIALLLQRAVERRLLRTPYRSATAAIQVLSSCRLNRFDKDGQSVYTVTRPNPDQAALLRALNLSFLADDMTLAETLRRHAA